MSNLAFGVDISQHQGNVNWARLVSNNISFVFIRAAYGTFIDRRLNTNWANAKAAGVFRGAYMFYRPANDGTPSQQAEAFVGALGGDLGELPLVVDVEKDPGNDLPPRDALVAGVRACLERVTQLSGRRPIIYTAKFFWQDTLGPTPWAADYDLWAAHWRTLAPGAQPLRPEAWPTWRFWQYSGDAGDGVQPGGPYGVDSQVIDLDMFNGDLDALRAYASRQPLPTPINERPVWAIAEPWLNFRSEPVVSEATLLGQLPFGTPLTALGPSTTDAGGNAWQRVRAPDGRTGWVCAFLAVLGQMYLSETQLAATKALELSASVAVLVVSRSGATLRERPAKGRILARLKMRQPLTLTDLSDTASQIGKRGVWLAVTNAEGRAGYVSAQNVKPGAKKRGQ